jgi:hypothetical protein
MVFSINALASVFVGSVSADAGSATQQLLPQSLLHVRQKPHTV